MKKVFILLLIILSAVSFIAVGESFLIEENIGDFFEFINSDVNPYCDIVDKGSCNVYFANYQPLVDGVDMVTVGIETHTETFSNSEAVEGITSEFGSSSNIKIEEESWRENHYYLFIRDENPYDVAVVWYSGTNVIAVIIENWDENKVDDDVFEDLLDAYFEKYPSDLEFEAEEEPIELPVEEPLCTDSDGGKSIYVAGEAQGTDGRGTFDYCTFLENSKGVLMEAICDEGYAKHVKIQCPSEAPYCNRAVCSPNPATCEDTDGGNNPYVKGTITEPRTAEGPTHTDYCENLDTKQPWNNCVGELCGLREYYCLSLYRTTTYQDVKCPAGCKDGVCLEEPAEEPVGTCTDSDGGKNYYVEGRVFEDDAYYHDKCVIPTKDYSGGYAEEGGVWYNYNSWDNDKCSGNDCYIAESYCINGKQNFDIEPCPNGCENGACVKEQKCTDTDGYNIFVKGITKGLDASGNMRDWIDFCEDTKHLREYTCHEDGQHINGDYVTCPNGCENGVCISSKKPFIIKGRLVNKYSRKPLSNVLITHVDNREGWRALEEAYTGSDGEFKFEDYTYESGYLLHFAPDCYSQAGIVGEKNFNTNEYEFYLYDTSEYCNEKKYPIKNGVVDLGEVGLQPAADIELYLDIPSSFSVYQKSKYCDYEIGGAGNGNMRREHYLSNTVLLGYKNWIVLNERTSTAIRSDPYEVPYREGCYKIQVKYENGKFEWSDLIEKVLNYCYNGIQDGDETGIDCGGSCEEPCEEEIGCIIGEFRCSPVYNAYDWCQEYEGKIQWLLKEYCDNGEVCVDGACVPIGQCVPEWECRLEPAECPPEGIQNKVCKDIKCGTGERREEAIRCIPGTCNGCFYDGICYPLMARMLLDNTPSYCDITKEFKKQKDLGLPCQNDYECKSNECSDGECISLKKELEKTQSLLRKILEWIGSIFS